MTSVDGGEGQIGFSGWFTSVYPESINMQEGLILHSLGDFLIPVGVRNSLESRRCFWTFIAFKGNQPQVFTRCDLSGSFVFVIDGKTVGFVHSLRRGMLTATGISGVFPAEGCNLSDFHVPFSISQITAPYGWMFGGLVLVVLPSHLNFLLVSKRWIG